MEITQRNPIPKTLEHWLEAGNRHYEANDFARATRAWEHALELDATNIEVKGLLARCHTQIGNKDRAIALLNELTAAESCPVLWQHDLARVLSSVGRTDEARAQYAKVWRAEPRGGLALELGWLGWQPEFRGNIDAGSSRFLGQLNAERPAVDEAQTLKEMEGISLPFIAWLYVYARLMRHGYASAAFAAKRKAADGILRQLSASHVLSGNALENAVAAACYVGAFDQAAALIERAPAASPQTWRSVRAHADLLLCQGKIAEARKVFSSAETSPGNQSFQKFLHGKRCAVVGPAVNALNNGAAIDAFDVRIRTNFMGRDRLAKSAAMLGTATDISYYTTEVVTAFEAGVMGALKRDPIPWVVVRHRGTRQAIRRKLADQQSRLWLSYKKRDFIGISFALRHMLFELALLGDQPIAVFGADFYLGDTPHYRGYLDQGIDVRYELARHDPFDTFMLLRTLWKAGFVEPDAVLKELLSEEPEDFCRRLSAKLAL